MQDKHSTPPATLHNARRIARQNGLRHVYTGNVHDRDGGSTWCHHCNELLIERDWFTLGQWHIEEQRCKHCETPVAGVFNDQPGQWGRKRVPVRMV